MRRKIMAPHDLDIILYDCIHTTIESELHNPEMMC